MPVVSISLPEELLESVDSFAEEQGYTGRSEVFRQSVRGLLGEFDESELRGRELMGTVTVLFEYGSSGVENEVTHLRHEYESLIVSNVHGHVGERYCMELFVIEGSLEDVSEVVSSVRTVDGVLTVDYSLQPIDDVGGIASPS